MVYMKQKIRRVIDEIIILSYLITIFFSILFTRPFVGVLIGPFRLGELIIGGCILLTFLLFTISKYFDMYEINNLKKTYFTLHFHFSLL